MKRNVTHDNFNNTKKTKLTTNWSIVKQFPDVRSVRLNRIERKILVKINHNFNKFDLLSNNVEGEIDRSYGEVMQSLLKDADPYDVYSSYVSHNLLENQIYVPPRLVCQFNEKDFLNSVYEIAQSNNDFLNDGLLTLKVMISKRINGGKRAPLISSNDNKNKRCVVKINSTDNTCGIRAIHIGIRKHENCSKLEWEYLRRNRKNLQLKGAIDLYRKANIPLYEALDLTSNINKIQAVIDYQIIVFQDDIKKRMLFKGPAKEKQIYLIYSEENNIGHFDLVTSMLAYLNKTYYCVECNVGYKLPWEHRCKFICKACFKQGHCEAVSETYCCTCNRIFFNEGCYLHHEKNICHKVNACFQCEMEYIVSKRKHICDEKKCHNCSQYYIEQPHYCLISSIPQRKLDKLDKALKIVVVYDTECQLISTLDNVYNHVPNLIVASVVCDLCYDNETQSKIYDCTLCGSFTHIYEGFNCFVDFVDFLILDLAKRVEKVNGQLIVVAHNNSGYDGHFLFRELCKRKIKKMSPLLNGTKLMKITAGNMSIIDSLLFFPMSLKKLASAFGLKEAKGYFPYYLNIPENWDKEININNMELDHFGYKEMSESDGKKLKTWFETQCKENKLYNIKSECIKYCENDVNILLKAIMQFRNLYKELTQIDPLSRKCTIASLGVEFFRAKILNDLPLKVTPISGYTRIRKSSYEALVWLDHFQLTNNVQIIREYSIGPYIADGFIDKPGYYNKESLEHLYKGCVLEYFGCYWHGCPKHFSEKLEEYNRVKEKIRYYESRNYYVIVCWGCDFIIDNEYKQNRYAYYKELIPNIKDLPSVNKCSNLRKALNGGRVEVFGFFATANDEIKLNYLDFTSLYPWVLKNKYYPVGDPDVISENFEHINNYFGFASVRILPPKNLNHPVLPGLFNNKLMFVLCRTCAENLIATECFHSDSERELTGTWTTMELQKAVEKGYQITHYYEVLHWKEKNNTVFRKYIEVWLKVKTESSGKPQDCDTDEKLNQFIEQYEQKENIKLDVSNMIYNAGKRTISKSFLVSLWGKMCEKPNKTKTDIITEYNEFWELFNNEKFIFVGEELVLDNVLLVSYKCKSDEKAEPGMTSVAVGAFVTSYGRLKLYEELEKIEDSFPNSVLYCDTDSIIFKSKPNSYKPVKGNFLGEMTDEIEGEFGKNTKLIEFYSTGPKSYCLKVLLENGEIKYKIKSKGLTQSIENKNILNFESMKNLTLDFIDNFSSVDKSEAKQSTLIKKTTKELCIPQTQFRSDKLHNVTSRKLNKLFSFTANKRKIIGFETRPYGFHENI